MHDVHKEVQMGFTDESFPAGTHMCLIYADDLERRELISRFLESGLAAGEKVGYFADTRSPEKARTWLLNAGVQSPHDDKAGQLTFAVAEQVYCPQGKFIPDEMLATLQDFYQQAIDEGFSGARVSGEMSWALRGIPGSDRLIEYEARINEVVPDYPITPICQYNASLFDGATILNVLKVHPMMIVHGQIIRNPYYMKPREFLDNYA